MGQDLVLVEVGLLSVAKQGARTLSGGKPEDQTAPGLRLVNVLYILYRSIGCIEIMRKLIASLKQLRDSKFQSLLLSTRDDIFH